MSPSLKRNHISQRYYAAYIFDGSRTTTGFISHTSFLPYKPEGLKLL